MTDKNYLMNRFGQAVQYLPPRLRSAAMQLNDDVKIASREFRLRAGEPLSVTTATREVVIPSETNVRHEELGTVVDIATGGSVHSAAESIKNGFITVAGGHRIGLCGTGVIRGGEVSFIKNISSVAIRIAKEF
ncbi:MAG: stage III sporulation protein AB, partial [Clostridia bacterium]